MKKDSHTEREAEEFARKFHDRYEDLAPYFGYETREDTREFDPNSPNGKLMISVCSDMLKPPEGTQAITFHIPKGVTAGQALFKAILFMSGKTECHDQLFLISKTAEQIQEAINKI